MRASFGGVFVAILSFVACTFDAQLYDPQATSSTTSATAESATGSDVSASSTSSQGGGTPTCDPATCPPPTEPCQVVGCANDVCAYVTITDGTILSDGEDDNCKGLLCDGTSPPQVVAHETDRFHDGNPCTLETCQGDTPKDDVVAEGIQAVPEGGAACEGVCQGHEFAGTCGYRLTRRTVTVAGPQGNWTTNALSFYWNGPNAPPPSHIQAVEETTTGARLMVFRHAPNEMPMYYERNGLTWKTPVPTATIWRDGTLQPPLDPATITSMSTGRSISPPGDADAGLISTTAAYVGAGCPDGIRIFYFGIPDTGPIEIQGSGCLEHRNKANTPPWESTPIDWAALHRTNSDPYAISFLGIGGRIYQENFNGTPPNTWPASTDEVTSSFGFGAASAPDYGSIVGVLSHRTLAELQFVSN